MHNRTETVQARVTVKEKEAFAKFCMKNELRESEMIRALIKRAIVLDAVKSNKGKK